MWRKNSWCLGIIIILCSSFVLASSVRINEVELNPEGTDSGNEWVELYSETEINLVNWKIMNNNGKNMTFNSSFLGYYIINTSYQLLTNADQKLYLINSSDDIIGETDIISDEENDNRAWSYCNEDWIFTNLTSGYENNCPSQSNVNDCDWKVEILLDNYIFNNGDDVNWTVKVSKDYGNKTNVSVRGYVKDMLTDWTMDYRPWTNESITSYRNERYNPNLWENKFYEIFFNITELSCEDTDLNDNSNYRFIMVLPYELSQDYTKLKINELFPDPQGNDDAAIPEGEWVELYNSGDKSLDLENLSLKDNYGQDPDIFISDTNTIDGTIINPQDYLIIYMNGRSSFLNNDGFEKISLFKENNLLDEVSYSGSVEGLTWGKVEYIWKLTLPTPNSINIYNESVNESILRIDSTDKEEYKFGDIVNVKLYIYKGNTDKYSIQAWVEKDDKAISKRSKVSIFTKFTEYDVTFPIQIFSNCKEEYEEGTYEVIVEGFDLSDEEKIKVEGNNEDMCDVIKEKIVEKEISQGVQTSEKDINASSSIEYISKEVKERNLAIYFFCVILIVMLIYFGLSKNV